jgi:hypothetical protein
MTPQTDRLIKQLSIMASVALTVTLAVSFLVVAWPRVTHALGIKAKPPAAAYAVGERVDVPVDWYSGRPHTLILFGRASCGACDNARPYLGQLVEFFGRRAPLVAAGGPETRDEDAAFARSLGVQDANIKTVPPGLRVRATPTLLLVNARGDILAAWEGVGQPDRQSLIASVIDGLTQR